MDEELEMDASGCWVRRYARVINETTLRSESEQYKGLVYSLDAKDTVDNEEQDDVLIIW